MNDDDEIVSRLKTIQNYLGWILVLVALIFASNGLDRLAAQMHLH